MTVYATGKMLNYRIQNGNCVTPFRNINTPPSCAVILSEAKDLLMCIFTGGILRGAQNDIGQIRTKVANINSKPRHSRERGDLVATFGEADTTSNLKFCNSYLLTVMFVSKTFPLLPLVYVIVEGFDLG